MEHRKLLNKMEGGYVALTTGKDGKECTKCNQWKKFSEFSPVKLGKYGYAAHCKNCKIIAIKEWQASEKFRRDACKGIILAFGDDQAPAHHPDIYSFLEAVKQRYKPKHIVHMGDEIDANQWSSYLKDPDNISANQEMDLALEHMHKLYQMFPKVDILRSNHVDGRFERLRQASGFSNRCMKSLEEILEMPKGWKRHTELFIDGTLFKHGHKDSQSLKAVIREHNLDRHGGFFNLVLGHHHAKFGRGTDDIIAGRGRRVWGAFSGCLVNKDHPYMQYSNGYEKLGCLIIDNGVPIPIPMMVDNYFRWTGELIGIYTGQPL